MKQKTERPAGNTRLEVSKTLDVLGPLHGYGIARRIEQISGDLLTVNQGSPGVRNSCKQRRGWGQTAAIMNCFFAAKASDLTK